MFSIIIAIVAVALVTLLVIATAHYGGSAVLGNGQTNAKAAQFINDGEQLRGAWKLYQADTGRNATELSELLENRTLASVPKGWSLTDGRVVNPDMDFSQCEGINKKLGISGVPSCADPDYADQQVCCDSGEDTPTP